MATDRLSAEQGSRIRQLHTEREVRELITFETEFEQIGNNSKDADKFYSFASGAIFFAAGVAVTTLIEWKSMSSFGRGVAAAVIPFGIIVAVFLWCHAKDVTERRESLFDRIKNQSIDIPQDPTPPSPVAAVEAVIPLQVAEVIAPPVADIATQ